MFTDLRAAAKEMRRGRLSILEYLNSFRSPLEFAVFAVDDALPVLVDIPFLAWLAFKRRLQSPHAHRKGSGSSHNNQRTIVDEGNRM